MIEQVIEKSKGPVLRLGDDDGLLYTAFIFKAVTEERGVGGRGWAWGGGGGERWVGEVLSRWSRTDFL